VSRAGEKQPYLVCYDYGTGGLWGMMLARSEEEIAGVYPELVVVRARPRWMSDDLYASICEHEWHDIDGAPWGILNAVLADRRRGLAHSAEPTWNAATHLGARSRPPPAGLRAARTAGRAWACPLFLPPGAAEVSGVKGSPQGCRAQRDAEHPWGRRGGPV